MRDKFKCKRSMRKALLLFSFLTLSITAYAQMANWIMRPEYDSIHLAAGVPVIISDSVNTTALWSTGGKRLASTADSLASFSDGLAVTVKKGSDVITGFYGVDGKFTPLKEYNTAWGFPYFRDGYLLVMKHGKGKLIGKDGKEDSFGSFVSMYPFSNGLACCTMYGDMEKLEDLYYYYIDKEKKPVKLMFDKKKDVDNEDVEFLSSVNDDGIGVAVIKHRVFFYDKEEGTLRPVFADDKAEKKRQARVNGDPDEYLSTHGDTTTIMARASKKDTVFLTFDKQMRLMSVKYPKRTDTYKRVEPGPMQFKADYTAERGTNGMYALKRGNTEVLPPQFETTGISLGRSTAVRSRGKWGLLAVYDSLDYRMSMNKGNAIAFRHQKFETTIRMDLPPLIKADNCGFDIPENSGCTIDKTSVQTRNTPSGNFVQYNCVLTIPDSLPDHITDIEYPVRVTCDGVVYPDSKLTVKAWHYKYINVDLSRDETKFAMGNIEFTVNISAEKIPGESDYPLYVDVVKDSASATRAELEKLSETRYKCRLLALAEGLNTLTIRVSESGCPPSLFPFEIYYTKSGSKGRGGKSSGGQIKITTKGKDGTTQSADVSLPVDGAAAATPAPADSTATAIHATPGAEAPADTVKAPQKPAATDSVATK